MKNFLKSHKEQAHEAPWSFARGPWDFGKLFVLEKQVSGEC